MKLSLLFPLLVGILSACGGVASRSRSRHGPLADPVDTVTDFIELEILQGGSPEELVEFFAEDALIMHAGQPTYEGKDQIKEALSWTNHVDVDGDYTVVKVFGGGQEESGSSRSGSGSRRHGLRRLQGDSNASPGVHVKVRMTVTGMGAPTTLKYREFYSLVEDEDGEYKIALLINNEDVDAVGHANL